MNRDKLKHTHYQKEGFGVGLWWQGECPECSHLRQIKVQFYHGSKAHERFVDPNTPKLDPTIRECECDDDDDMLD